MLILLCSQDDSTLPLEPFLDYSAFALRVSVPDIDRLDQILGAISPALRTVMLRRVLQVQDWFDWDFRKEGKAHEGALLAAHEILRRRGLVP
jgi:hypothetical protein